ncbi:MAG TPA: hypothetical protein VJ246_01430 [Patescibacteria group bacterium]|nr:hypothetical protein [Patescibacteria group bacterium]
MAYNTEDLGVRIGPTHETLEASTTAFSLDEKRRKKKDRERRFQTVIGSVLVVTACGGGCVALQFLGNYLQ